MSAGSGELAALPYVPQNLLTMMGLSFVTAAASKGITVSYLKDNEISSADASGVASDRDARTDVTKVQMLIWTVIAWLRAERDGKALSLRPADPAPTVVHLSNA